MRQNYNRDKKRLEEMKKKKRDEKLKKRQQRPDDGTPEVPENPFLQGPQ